MKVYIHIGFGKTGTTSIQDTLYKNHELLSSQGFLYPSTGLRGTGHHNLCNSQNSQSLINELKKEIKEKSPRSAVISSEFFTFAKKEIIDGLKRELSEFHPTVVFYIRDQKKLIESTFLQWQKVGADYRENIESFYNLHKDSFDFTKRIEPWSEAFGEENIIARIYDKQIIGDDVFKDFSRIIELNPKETVSIRENRSIIPEFSELISKIDKTIPLESEERKEIINKILELSDTLRASSKKNLITKDLEAKIKLFYSESNKSFFNKYLNCSPETFL